MKPKNLSNLEKHVIELLETDGKMTHEELYTRSGLHENVIFNILQVLVIRGIVTANGLTYSLEASKKVGIEKTVIIGERDAKILAAMLANLDSFIRDAERSSKTRTGTLAFKINCTMEEV